MGLQRVRQDWVTELKLVVWVPYKMEYIYFTLFLLLNITKNHGWVIQSYLKLSHLRSHFGTWGKTWKFPGCFLMPLSFVFTFLWLGCKEHLKPENISGCRWRILKACSHKPKGGKRVICMKILIWLYLPHSKWTHIPQSLDVGKTIGGALWTFLALYWVASCKEAAPQPS